MHERIGSVLGSEETGERDHRNGIIEALSTAKDVLVVIPMNDTGLVPKYQVLNQGDGKDLIRNSRLFWLINSSSGTPGEAQLYYAHPAHVKRTENGVVHVDEVPLPSVTDPVSGEEEPSVELRYIVPDVFSVSVIFPQTIAEFLRGIAQRDPETFRGVMYEFAMREDDLGDGVNNAR